MKKKEINQDLKKAFEYYQEACILGDSQAMVKLGRFYEMKIQKERLTYLIVIKKGSLFIKI
jgi:TPR repeat protein